MLCLAIVIVENGYWSIVALHGMLIHNIRVAHDHDHPHLHVAFTLTLDLILMKPEKNKLAANWTYIYFACTHDPKAHP